MNMMIRSAVGGPQFFTFRLSPRRFLSSSTIFCSVQVSLTFLPTDALSMTRQGPVMLIRVMLTVRECTFLGGGDRVQTYTSSGAYVHCPVVKQFDDEYYTQSLFYLALKVNIAAWKRISSRISTNQVVASWLSVNTISAKGSELNAVCRCVIEIYQIYIFIPPHKAVTRST